MGNNLNYFDIKIVITSATTKNNDISEKNARSSAKSQGNPRKIQKRSSKTMTRTFSSL
jgi:hypothetical protein